MPRRWYWKVYLVLMAVLTVVGVGFSLYYWDETASLEHIAEWVSLPMYVVQLVGLFGFIYWRRIGSPLLWKFVFGATVLELVWAAYETAENVDLFLDSAFPLASFALAGAIVSLPLLVALYVYAFRSPALWARAT